MVLCGMLNGSRYLDIREEKMKTIAQQLNIKDFPFIIRNKDGKIIYHETSDGYWLRWGYANGNQIYFETSNGYWSKWGFDSNGNQTYSEDSYGIITDNRPSSCNVMIVEIDGKKYRLEEI
jgi:hypothetical protein